MPFKTKDYSPKNLENKAYKPQNKKIFTITNNINLIDALSILNIRKKYRYQRWRTCSIDFHIINDTD